MLNTFLGFLVFVAMLCGAALLGALAGALYCWRTRVTQFAHVPLGWIIAAVIPVISVLAPTIGIAWHGRALLRSSASRMFLLTGATVIGGLLQLGVPVGILVFKASVGWLQVFAWVPLLCWLIEPFLGVALMKSPVVSEQAIGRLYLKTVLVLSGAILSALLITAFLQVGGVTLAAWATTAMASGYLGMLLRMRFFEEVLRATQKQA